MVSFSAAQLGLVELDALHDDPEQPQHRAHHLAERTSFPHPRFQADKPDRPEPSSRATAAPWSCRSTLLPSGPSAVSSPVFTASSSRRRIAAASRTSARTVTRTVSTAMWTKDSDAAVFPGCSEGRYRCTRVRETGQALMTTTRSYTSSRLRLGAYGRSG